MLRGLFAYDGYGSAADLAPGLPGLFTAIGGASLSTSSPRTGTKFLRAWLAGGESQFNSPGGSRSGGTIGSGFRADTASNRRICGFKDSGTYQVYLQFMNGTQQLAVYRGDGTQLWISDITETLAFATWYFVELEVVFHNSAGEVRVWVNNNQWANETGLDTTNTANASFNQFMLGAASEGNFDFDDTYFLDNAAGDGKVAALGDIRVKTLYAQAGNGSLTGSTPSSGTDRGAMVDDAAQDGDTSYNAFAAAGQTDSYHHENMGVTGTVHGVAARVMARKTDMGAATIQAGVRVGSSNYLESAFGPSTSYQYVSKVMGQNPGTASDWTISDVDGVQTAVTRAA